MPAAVTVRISNKLCAGTAAAHGRPGNAHWRRAHRASFLFQPKIPQRTLLRLASFLGRVEVNKKLHDRRGSHVLVRQRKQDSERRVIQRSPRKAAELLQFVRCAFAAQSPSRTCFV
eukprot:Amastigsp_a346158_29.p1 type:complete len:116 gc:universal Amastigsp_a346158_29:378-31(-)